MHQHGIGLDKDKPLAKRYYDNGLFLAIITTITPASNFWSSSEFEGDSHMTRIHTVSLLVQPNFERNFEQLMVT